MIRRIIISLSLVCALSISAAEAVTKMAVVDVEKVFYDYYKTKIVESQIEEQQTIYANGLAQLNKQLAELEKEYRELRDAAENVTLKEAQRREKERDAAKKFAEVNAKRTEVSEYMTEKGQKLMEMAENKRTEIHAEILGEVRRRAHIDGIDVIFDISGKTTTGFAAVIFHNPDIDITAKIVEELNRGNKKAAEK